LGYRVRVASVDYKVNAARRARSYGDLQASRASRVSLDRVANAVRRASVD